MTRPILLLTVCSLIGCAGIERPDATLCVVNAPGHKLVCHNLKTDYDDQGELIPGVKQQIRAGRTIDDLNKYICTDPDSWANLKAYLKNLRQEYQKQ